MAPLYDSGVIQDLLISELDRRGRGAQTRLAEAIGVRVQTVNKWYKRQTTPDPEKWPLIERHFEWPKGHIATTAIGSDLLKIVPSDLLERLRYLVGEIHAIREVAPEVTRAEIDREVVGVLQKFEDYIEFELDDEQFAQAAESGPTEHQGPSQHRPSPPPEPEGP